MNVKWVIISIKEKNMVPFNIHSVQAKLQNLRQSYSIPDLKYMAHIWRYKLH